ncbi:MAG: hypothetical protein QOI50_6569 [Pseudonocardiales bacterium]|nr:hypothetical protein [Pseudonocardiales bacterium]
MPTMAVPLGPAIFPPSLISAPRRTPNCSDTAPPTSESNGSTTGPSARSTDSVRARPVWSYRVKSGTLSPVIINRGYP